MDRKLLKSNAKMQLGGGIFKTNWMTALLVCLLSTILISVVSGAIYGFTGGFSFDPEVIMDENADPTVLLSSVRGVFTGSGVGSLALIVLSGPLAFGLANIFLGLVMGKGKVEVGDLFSGFKTDFLGTFLIGLFTFIFTFLWSLLFIIPGIVKSYAYSMAYYVKVEHPDYGWRQCINESKRITKGHKGQLFVLDLSFIGWGILCCFTFGLGFLWLAPYIDCTKANAYAYLTANDAPAYVPGSDDDYAAPAAPAAPVEPENHAVPAEPESFDAPEDTEA